MDKMPLRDFELVVCYSNWKTEVYDGNANLQSSLQCKSNGWFSNFLSGTATINNQDFTIRNRKGSIQLLVADKPAGSVTIASQNNFGRQAAIELEGRRFTLLRENLQQLFTVEDAAGVKLLSIEGKLYPHKQRNLFGLLYFDNKLYHSVYQRQPVANPESVVPLLTVCGYCIRLFLQIDAGDYPGEVLRIT